MADFTPGPWALQRDFPIFLGGRLYIVAGTWPLGTTICEVEDERSASLLVHAPDLAEVLEWIALFADVRSKDDRKTFATVNRAAFREIARKAGAALAKARGDIPVERAIDHLTALVETEVR